MEVTVPVPSSLLGPHRVYLTVYDAATNAELATDRFSYGTKKLDTSKVCSCEFRSDRINTG